jgi:hypothetical protein
MRYAPLMLLGCLGVGVFIAAQWSPLLPSKNSAAHVSAAINYHNEAAVIENKSCVTVVVCPISAAEWSAIYDYDKSALGEAQHADIADMNKHYPGFGDHFRDEFIAGLKLIVENGNDSANGPAFIRGQILVHRFGDWFVANEDAIRGRK